MKIVAPATSGILHPDFVFGVATSSFQIEGAADARLPSIWDTFCATPGKIRDNSNGLVACDHVARWKDDVDLIASLGVDAYRFSISWPRVVRRDGTLNSAGIDFYKRLLDALNERHIKPFVTLYHWDLPQHLEDRGGWLARETAYRFRDYADLVTRALADRVYSYATLNEPFCSAYLGYEVGIHAPGLTSRKSGNAAAHHLLLAHGLGMDVLRTNSPRTLNGVVLNFSPCYAASANAEDQAAAELADATFNQWYLRPLLEQRYPDLLDQLSPDERPPIQAGDLEIIGAPIDYLGVNYYTRSVYRADAVQPFVQVPPAAPLTDMGWEIYPQGLTDLLTSLHRRYSLPPVYIAENGIAVADAIEAGVVRDDIRTQYIQQHLDAVDRAMDQGVAVAGYFYWSLMDNFEWAEGYAKRFGIVHVDFATQQRTLKASGAAFRDFLLARHRGS
jgi:beta-glucosidase